MFRKWLKQRLAFAVTGLLCSTGLSYAASVEPLDIRPPVMDVKPICLVKERIDAARQRWQAWNPSAESGIKTGDIRAAAKRLASFDAKANFEVAEKLLRHLMADKDKMVAAHAGSDLVKLYVEAQRLDRSNSKTLLPLIEQGPLAGTPSNLYVEGLIHEQGLALDQDRAKAVAFFEAAALAKNPDALLALARLKQTGAPEAQHIDIPLTITLAVNAILDDRTPEICDHIKRIARMYVKGDYVAKNDGVAAAWLRLAADFGDADAAWALARMHLRSELIVKDNAVLLKYMTLAAERGVVQAMIELATVYADGSLGDTDPLRAESWFQKASDSGSMQAKIRFLEFYQRLSTAEADQKAESLLRKIAASAEAPSRLLVELGKLELAMHGNVDGPPLARPLFERAAALDDGDARLGLAKLIIPRINSAETFQAAANNMMLSAGAGNSDAMLELSSLYMCHSPGEPDFKAAAAWRNQALGAGNAHAELELAIGKREGTVDARQKIAMMRSEALAGTSNALAYLIDAFDRLGPDKVEKAELEFWRARLSADASSMWRYAKISGDRANAVPVEQYYESAIALGSTTARIDLAKLLMAKESRTAAEEARIDALLLEAAQNGRGEAMELLQSRKGEADFREFFNAENLVAVIRNRGDYRAYLVAANFTDNPEERISRVSAAAAAVDCTFDGALRMAQALLKFGKQQEATRWAEIAHALVPQDGDAAYKLARFYTAVDRSEYALRISELLNKAADFGNNIAMLKLLPMVTDARSPAFDPERAVKIANRLGESKDPKSLYTAARALLRVGNRVVVRDEIPEDMLRRAAEQNYAPAMREYGSLISRGESVSVSNPSVGIDWLQRAADADDPGAMVELSRAYALGVGVEASLPKAKELLQRAEKLGKADAVDLLQALARM